MSSFSQNLVSSIMAWNTSRTSRFAVGCTSEGSIVTRVFYQNKTDSENDMNKEVETDIEFNVMEIPKSYQCCIEDLPDKLGYVKFQCNDSINDDIRTFVKDVGLETDRNKMKDELKQQIIDDGYIKPNRLKENVIGKGTLGNKNQALELILAAALDLDVSRISLSHHIDEVTKTSIENYFDVYIDDKEALKISWDVVLVVKLLWWPEVAKEWIERERNWPDKEFVYSIANISYVITKPSADEKLDKDSLELRYSFDHVERALVSRRSPQQKLVYLIFKSMIYKYLKPIDSVHIHSFIAKIIMFWACEMYPPDHAIWGEDEESILNVLTLLFTELLKSFEERNLPYYFLPQINVIENINDDVILKVIAQINLILSNVKGYIPKNVDKVIDTCKEMLRWVKSIYDVLDKIKKKDYSILIRRPDLIPKFVDVFGSDLKEGSFHFSGVRKKVDSVKENVRNIKLPNVYKEVNHLKDNFKCVERDVKKMFSVVPHVQKEVSNLKGNLKSVEKEAKEMLKKLKF